MELTRLLTFLKKKGMVMSPAGPASACCLSLRIELNLAWTSASGETSQHTHSTRTRCQQHERTKRLYALGLQGERWLVPLLRLVVFRGGAFDFHPELAAVGSCEGSLTLDTSTQRKEQDGQLRRAWNDRHS